MDSHVNKIKEGSDQVPQGPVSIEAITISLELKPTTSQ